MLSSFPYNRGRLQEMARNRIGLIFKGSSMAGTPRMQNYLYRRVELHLLDDYLNNKAYDHLPPWDPDISDQQMDQRKNQPKLVFPMPEISTGIVNGLVTSDDSRLMFNLDDIELQKNLDRTIEDINLWNYINFILPSLLCNGSTFLKIFKTADNYIMMKRYNSKSCWPTFDGSGKLLSITIRYIYDTGEFDEKDQKIYRWSQQVLGQELDILYDNPIFEPGLDEPPDFKEMGRIEHGLGFVQGVWFTTTLWDSLPDGQSYIEGSIPFFDSLNYLLSKENSVLYYNLFPLLMGYGIDPDDFEDMKPENKYSAGKIKGMNVLSTGKPPDQASLGFLESSMNGLQISESYHQRMLQLIQYSLKSVLLDPERIASHAQSAKAMEALHRPVIQYTKKIRPNLKKGICEVMQIVEDLSNIYECNIKIPKGTILESDKKWGTIFEDTTADVAQKVGYASNAVLSKIISKKTATKLIAPNFGVENIEEELTQISNEKEEEFEDERLFNEMTTPPKPTGGNSGQTPK